MDIAMIVLKVYLVGLYIAGGILLHPDWEGPLIWVYKDKAGIMQDVWTLGSWYTVIKYQRKWIVKEIKHIIKNKTNNGKH